MLIKQNLQSPTGPKLIQTVPQQDSLYRVPLQLHLLVTALLQRWHTAVTGAAPPSTLPTNIHSPSGGAPVSPVPRPRQSINRRHLHMHTHTHTCTHIDNLKMLRGTTGWRGKVSERKEVMDGWRTVLLSSERGEEDSHYVLLCLTATVL